MTQARITYTANVPHLPDEAAGQIVEVIRGPEGPINLNGDPHWWCRVRLADGTHHEGFMRVESVAAAARGSASQ